MKQKKDKYPLVNIIILTFNQFNFVGECIEAVIKSNYPNLKFYLVDNNSNHSDYKEFYEKFKNTNNIEFFRLKENIGFAGGCNYALKKIKSGYIVFLNDDVIVDKDWLMPIISYMEENPEVGACQPKIKNMRKKNEFEYAGAAGGFMDVYGYPFARGRLFFNYEKDKGQYDSITDLVWCSGACLITNVNVIKNVGLFDEIFFIYGDESDLCWRMHLKGYKLKYIPASVVYHHGSGTMSKFKFKKTFLHHRNGLILLLKNYRLHELIRYLPIRIVFDYIAFWYYLLVNREIKNAIAVPLAHLSVLYNFPYLYSYRKKTLRDNLNFSGYPLYKKSIIIEYFLLGKKKFSQLDDGKFVR